MNRFTKICVPCSIHIVVTMMDVLHYSHLLSLLGYNVSNDSRSIQLSLWTYFHFLWLQSVDVNFMYLLPISIPIYYLLFWYPIPSISSVAYHCHSVHKFMDSS